MKPASWKDRIAIGTATGMTLLAGCSEKPQPVSPKTQQNYTSQFDQWNLPDSERQAILNSAVDDYIKQAMRENVKVAFEDGRVIGIEILKSTSRPKEPFARPLRAELTDENGLSWKQKEEMVIRDVLPYQQHKFQLGLRKHISSMGDRLVDVKQHMGPDSLAALDVEVARLLFDSEPERMAYIAARDQFPAQQQEVGEVMGAILSGITHYNRQQFQLEASPYFILVAKLQNITEPQRQSDVLIEEVKEAILRQSYLARMPEGEKALDGWGAPIIKEPHSVARVLMQLPDTRPLFAKALDALEKVKDAEPGKYEELFEKAKRYKPEHEAKPLEQPLTPELFDKAIAAAIEHIRQAIQHHEEMMKKPAQAVQPPPEGTKEPENQKGLRNPNRSPFPWSR